MTNTTLTDGYDDDGYDDDGYDDTADVGSHGPEVPSIPAAAEFVLDIDDPAAALDLPLKAIAIDGEEFLLNPDPPFHVLLALSEGTIDTETIVWLIHPDYQPRFSWAMNEYRWGVTVMMKLALEAGRHIGAVTEAAAAEPTNRQQRRQRDQTRRR